jgi:F-type H+-transporting ATPase subunit gamma
MAGGQERILRRRIKSVQSTKKITRAMELIAASRIVKAQARVAAAVPYADRITDVARHLQESGGSNHPLLLPRPEIKTVALVVIGADRGLCGGYNSSVIRAAEAELREHALARREYALVTVGRKVEGYFRFRNFRIQAAHAGFSGAPSYEDAREIAGSLLAPFEAGEFDLVQTVYTRFISAGRQEVIVRPLLPLDREGFEGGNAASAVAHHATPTAPEGPAAAYEFEPNPEAILDELLPRYAQARVYAALLNAAASEHAARQRAMKSATDNADELIRSLSRVMNRARQEQITTEIMEIVGGAEALQSDGDAGDEHERFDFGGVRAALTASHTGP